MLQVRQFKKSRGLLRHGTKKHLGEAIHMVGTTNGTHATQEIMTLLQKKYCWQSVQLQQPTVVAARPWCLCYRQLAKPNDANTHYPTVPQFIAELPSALLFNFLDSPRSPICIAQKAFLG
jgi:hypothetical protein